MRNELLHIGEELVAMGLGTAPIDVARVGSLMRQLALLYGRLVHDEVQAVRAVRPTPRKPRKRR